MSDWRCPLCECRQADWLFDGIDAMETTHRSFALVQCRQCSLFSLRLRPQRHETLCLYPQGYEPFWVPLKEETNLWLRWMRRRHWSIRCRAVHRAKPGGGRLLDVGCATGHFLYELCRDRQWQGVGVDINESALDVARRQGVSVLCGALDDLRLPTASFDIVTMWEVIEHMPDPVDALSEVHRILKPGGVMLLSTPNGESIQAYLWRKHWCGWEVPRHLQVFSTRTLRRLLDETRFEVVRQLYFPEERFYAVESASRWLQLYRGGPLRAVARRLLSLIGWAAWPVFRLMDYTLWRSSIVWETRAIS